MEYMPAPIPDTKTNSQSNLIKSKNYEILLENDIYILLMEKCASDKIYFQLHKQNNFTFYHSIYKYKELVELLFLQKKIYSNISKIFNYLDSAIKEKKMDLEYYKDNKIMILKLKREIDQKDIDCIIELKEIKMQNNKLINELEKKNEQNKVIINDLTKQKLLLEKKIEKYEEYLDEDNINMINDNKKRNNGLDFLNEPDNENLKKFFKENEDMIKFITKFVINICLPFSILLLSLFQLYFQYSYLVYPKNPKKDKQKDLIDYFSSFLYKKEEKSFFDPLKVKEIFGDNPIIFLFKLMTPESHDKSNEMQEINSEQINSMIYFLLFYDSLYYISIFFSIHQNIKATFILIIFQSLKFYFTNKRMNIYYLSWSLLYIFYDHISKCSKNEREFFSPEGFQILEYLFNFVIIFDFIWLFILIKRKYIKKILATALLLEKIANDENNTILDNNKTNNIKKEQ